mmetsp:Transcript_30703/g.46076  ORF Transcript_30703/g.46076 Transcript_30703/m.46076 type:complete len:410 (+) Transcript_30703:67-1296(+)
MTSGEVEEHQNQHLDENDDDVAETSPESAALVRGASRSVATAGKGAMVGRLPMPSKAASTAVSKTSRVRPAVRARPAVRSVPKAPRSMPRAPRGSARLTSKIPKGRRANTIAKVSDRASNIFDVVSAGSESTGNDGSTKKMSERQASSLQKLKSMLPTFQQTISFSRVFAVNTVLGMAVYGTYEGLIDRYAPVAEHSDEPNIHVLNNATGQIYTGSEELADENDDAMERATLPQHFMAGGLGGASHAILSLGLEMKVHNKSTIPQQGMNHNIANATIMNKIHLQYPTMNYSLSSLFHHSMAHAILFGSYQTTKRMLLSNITLPNNNNNNCDISHAAIISTAGGIAGQLQHVTSHLSEQYLGISGPRVPSFRHLTWPTLRSTLLAFPMSSIGFVAFEYGKLMMNADESTE